MKKFVFAWLPVLLWCGVIYYFSSQPQIQTSDFYLWDFLIKKTAHISEYAILTALLFRAVRLSINHWQTRSYYLVPGILSVLYAVSDEFHQRFTPGRTSTTRDVFIDVLGITITLILLFHLTKNPKKYTMIKSLLSLS